MINCLINSGIETINKMKNNLIAGTRGSKLALKQTEYVVNYLKSLYPDITIDIKVIKTTGDKIQDKALNKIGGKGLFIKEIEEALLTNSVDFAVHSAKDVPHTLSDDFTIGAILKREDVRDILIAYNEYDISSLSHHSTVGTGSLRRKVQLLSIRPDIIAKPIRGNIDTRLKKLLEGDCDAIILASAGLKRLGWTKEAEYLFFKILLNKELETTPTTSYLDTNSIIPSPGQGALLIENRKNDADTINIIKKLNDDESYHCVMTERSFLKEINGGCDIPIGAYCYCKDNKLFCTGFIGVESNNQIFKSSESGEMKDYEKIGVLLAQNVLKLKNEDKGT